MPRLHFPALKSIVALFLGLKHQNVIAFVRVYNTFGRKRLGLGRIGDDFGLHKHPDGQVLFPLLLKMPVYFDRPFCFVDGGPDQIDFAGNSVAAGLWNGKPDGLPLFHLQRIFFKNVKFNMQVVAVNDLHKFISS